DFGLVKELAASDPELSVAATGASVVVGTPHYLAPEAITTPDRVDARSDLYALGALGFFLLTATPVFDGRTVVEVCGRHLHTPPEPPSNRLGKSVPASLEKIVLACLAKDPNDRPESATALRARLEGCGIRAWTDADARAWWTRWNERRDGSVP